jgi:cellulose synthase/poly-beta-1,6-N-acetylglucosamine synthase-like glycosyltransferase
MSPSISVLMPCYNAAATLDEAVGSILRQTLTDFELIAVDDGSSDQTGALLQAWAERERRAVVLTQAHGGQVLAFRPGWPPVERRSSPGWTPMIGLCPSVARQAAIWRPPEVAVVGCLRKGSRRRTCGRE